MTPSSTTTVSTPSTGAAALTASALRRAFSTAVSRGSPSVSSSASLTTTVKSTPSCSRIARRCGEREARIRSGSASAQVREEDRRLARRRLVRVRAVDHVLADLERVVAADRARRSLDRVGGSDHLAGGLDGLVALEHGGD